MGQGAPEGVGPGSAPPRPPTRPGARASSGLAARAPRRAPRPGARPGANVRLVHPAGGSRPCPALLPPPTQPFGTLELEESLGSLVAGDLAAGPGSALAAHPVSPGPGSFSCKMEDDSQCPAGTSGVVGWALPAWRLVLDPAALRITWEAF